jgi:hypothetical protein
MNDNDVSPELKPPQDRRSQQRSRQQEDHLSTGRRSTFPTTLQSSLSEQLLYDETTPHAGGLTTFERTSDNPYDDGGDERSVGSQATFAVGEGVGLVRVSHDSSDIGVVCNFHVLSHLLLIYICKLHWNLNTMFVCQVNYF